MTTESFRFDILPPFFTNLLSEGWLRNHQAKKARVDKNDEFGLLCANGQELIGGVSVRADRLSSSPAELSISQTSLPAITAPDLLQAQGVRIIGLPQNFETYAFDYGSGQSVSGVQRKLLMKREGKFIVPTRSGGQYIVKPAPEHAANLPENEFFIMQLAKKVGFDVAECGLIAFESGELAYITKRFDLFDSNQRYLIEDAASLCQVHPKHKDSEVLSYERVIKQLTRCAGNSKAVSLNLFLQVVYSHIVGNNDMHLKNISMARKPDTKNTIMDFLSPMYDMLSVAPYPIFDRACFMSIGVLAIEESGTDEFSDAYNTFGFYTKQDFVQLGVNIGLPKLMVERQIVRLKEKVLNAVDGGFRTEIPDAIYDAIIKRIRQRCRTLEMENK